MPAPDADLGHASQQQSLRRHDALQRLRALKLISAGSDGAPRAAAGGSPPRREEGHRSAFAATGGLDAHPGRAPALRQAAEGGRSRCLARAQPASLRALQGAAFEPLRQGAARRAGGDGAAARRHRPRQPHLEPIRPVLPQLPQTTVERSWSGRSTAQRLWSAASRHPHRHPARPHFGNTLGQLWLRVRSCRGGLGTFKPGE